jgi:prohibitin 2
VFVVQAIIILAAIAMAILVGRRIVSAERIDYRALIEAVAIVAVAIGITSSFGEIPAGSRGVVLRFGATTGEVKQPGFYVITPFIESVQPINCQVVAFSADASAASLDLQTVQTKVTLNYSVDPDKVVDLYNRLNMEYEDRIVAPSIQEATKATTARFKASDLITERQIAQDALEKNLDTRLQSFDMHVAAISITDFQFSTDFANAIEAKVVAYQNFLQAQNKLKQIQVEAQQNIAQAQGEATATRLRREQITPLTVEYDAVHVWDGKLPGVVGGAIPFFNLGNLDSQTTPNK